MLPQTHKSLQSAAATSSSLSFYFYNYFFSFFFSFCILVLILLGQNCTGKTLLQCCLNTPWTTLHRLIKSQCNFSLEAPDNITQEKFCSLS